LSRGHDFPRGVVLKKEVGDGKKKWVDGRVKFYGYKYNLWNIYFWSSWTCAEIGLSK